MVVSKGSLDLTWVSAVRSIGTCLGFSLGCMSRVSVFLDCLSVPTVFMPRILRTKHGEVPKNLHSSTKIKHYLTRVQHMHLQFGVF